MSYVPNVSWETRVGQVNLSSTGDHYYECNLPVKNLNDKGAGTLNTDLYLIDYLGYFYEIVTIIDSATNRVEVYDINEGQQYPQASFKAPYQDMIGFVCQLTGAGIGLSVFQLRRLHGSARDAINYQDNLIIWQRINWLDNISMAGRLWGGEITNNGDGTVTVAEGGGVVKNDDTALESVPTSLNEGQGSKLSHVTWSSTTLTPTDNAYNYIFYDGSAGIITHTTSFYSISFTRDFTVGRVYKYGGEVAIRLCGTNNWNFNRRVQLFGEERFPVERATGLMIGNPSGLYISTTEGVLWAELVNRFSVDSFDSSGTDTFNYWYRDGAGGHTRVLSNSEIDNTNYDDGSGTLAALTTNRYGVHWVYAVHDSSIHTVYGRGNYQLKDAQTATPPPDIPGLLSAYSTLIGKIIVQKSSTTLYSVESPFVDRFTSSGVTDHGNLAGLGDDDHSQYLLLAGRSGQYIDDSITISGDLTVNGTEFITNTETVEIEDNLAIINSGETGSGITAGFAGWEADRGTLTNYRWGFDETTDLWRLGEVGSLQAVATRPDSPSDNYIGIWDTTNSWIDFVNTLPYHSTLLSNYDTGDLSEGTNLYYTNERVDDRVNNLLASSDAITLSYDDIGNTLTIGESHSALTNNPHSVTATQVSALVSIDGVSNAGGNVDLVNGGNVTITPDNTNNKITLSVPNDLTVISNYKETVQDYAWDVLTGTQTLITVTYDDTNNEVDFEVEPNLSNYTNDVGWTTYDSSDFDTDFSGKTTDDLSEGASNQYFTGERAQDAVGTILTDTTSIDLTYDDAGNSITASVLEAGVDHNSLSNYVSNEHIDHTSVTLTAGTGLTGGGDISANRTFDVDVGIADNKIVQIDDADAADNDYAKFTANGLEGRSYSEVLSDLSLSSNLQNLTDAEVTQLENINTETISNTQWGYLGAMSGQPLESVPTLQNVTDQGNSTDKYIRTTGTDEYTELRSAGIYINRGSGYLAPLSNQDKNLNIGSYDDGVADWKTINYRALTHNFSQGNVNITDGVLQVDGTGYSYFSDRLSIGKTTAADEFLDIMGSIKMIGSPRGLKFSRGSDNPTFSDFDFPDLSASSATMRFFRLTNTTGTKAVEFYKGDGTSTRDVRIGVDGENSYFAGNLSVGKTTAAAEALDVDGSIALQGRLYFNLDGDNRIQFDRSKSNHSFYIQREGTIAETALTIVRSGSNFYTGVNQNIYPSEALDVSGNIAASGTVIGSNLNISNWDTAYGDKINLMSFDTSTGILTLTRQDSGTITQDLDGRYVTSSGLDLQDVTDNGNITTNAIYINSTNVGINQMSVPSNVSLSPNYNTSSGSTYDSYYRVKIVAKSKLGETVASSASPTLDIPSLEETFGELESSWTDVTGAVSYKVYLDESNDGSSWKGYGYVKTVTTAFASITKSYYNLDADDSPSTNTAYVNEFTSSGLKLGNLTDPSGGNRCLYVDGDGIVRAKSEDCGTATGDGDNLGNHIATQNIDLNGNYLSGDGDSEGISIDTLGNVSMTGALTVSSNITANNFILSSDMRLKENVCYAIQDSIDDINIFSFNFKDSDNLRYGVSAQQVEKINPEFVSENKEGYKQVAYIDLLLAKVVRLEQQIKELKEI